jgi:hypothetical protein
VNFYYGRARLIEKRRNGRGVTRRYDEMRTPYARLLAAKAFSADDARRLETRFDQINPFDALRERERLLDRLWDLGRGTR